MFPKSYCLTVRVSLQEKLALNGYDKAWLIGVMSFVTLVKLFLTFYCRSYKNEIVRAYAQDHFFDVMTNSIGLLAAIMASQFYWWMDPAGAILVYCSFVVILILRMLQIALFSILFHFVFSL